jgi:peptidoglycan/LPS O-acetylase OafA/YrhL
MQTWDAGRVVPTGDGPAPFRLGYRAWLDGLRGVAVLVVVAGHLHFFPGGFIGVDLFFVLSGFLITALLLEEHARNGRISVTRFYARRALRLLPSVAFVLVALLAYTHLVRSPSEAAGTRREAVVVACYLSNWQTVHRVPMPTLGHTWSLSLEEQFYLIWPVALLCALALRARRRTVLAIIVLTIGAASVNRVIQHRDARAAGTAEAIARLYMGLDTRIDALLAGCLIGAVAVWGLLPTGPISRRVVALWAICGVPTTAYWVTTLHLGKPILYDGLFTLLAANFAAIVVHLLVNPAPVWRWVLESRVLTWLGRVSYSVYLVHIPIFHYARPAGLRGCGWDERLALGAAAVVAGALLHYAVERPFLRLKGRWSASAPPAPTPRAPVYAPARAA